MSSSGYYALVPLVHVARCLLAASCGLAPGRANATELVLTALEQALALCQPASSTPNAAASTPQSGLSAEQHSGQDNAQAEADWSTLKTELLPHDGAFASLKEVWLEVA